MRQQVNHRIESCGEQVHVAAGNADRIECGGIDPEMVVADVDQRAHDRIEVPAESGGDVPAGVEIIAGASDAVDKSGADLSGNMRLFLCEQWPDGECRDE